MGRIVKQVSEDTMKYYWYPGDKTNWVKAGIAFGLGVAIFALAKLFTDGMLWGAVLGASATLAVAGFNFGRRDSSALHAFPDIAAARRAAVVDAGRAAWRALVEGFGAAAAAVLIVNIPLTGFVYNWILPIVPAIIGALGHKAGMLYERLNQAATQEAAEAKASRRFPLVSVEEASEPPVTDKPVIASAPSKAVALEPALNVAS